MTIAFFNTLNYKGTCKFESHHLYILVEIIHFFQQLNVNQYLHSKLDIPCHFLKHVVEISHFFRPQIVCEPQTLPCLPVPNTTAFCLVNYARG